MPNNVTVQELVDKVRLKVLQGELKAAINRMDSYIEENAKKQ